jgi:hypothetical protein
MFIALAAIFIGACLLLWLGSKLFDKLGRKQYQSTDNTEANNYAQHRRNTDKGE